MCMCEKYSLWNVEWCYCIWIVYVELLQQFLEWYWKKKFTVVLALKLLFRLWKSRVITFMAEKHRFNDFFIFDSFVLHFT